MSKNRSAVVKNLRFAYQETQKEFAKRLDVSVSTVRRWETGKIKDWEKVSKVKTIDNRDHYFKYQKKQGYQVKLANMEKDNDTTYTRMRSYADQQELIADIGSGKQYKGKSMAIIGFRTVSLKKG